MRPIKSRRGFILLFGTKAIVSPDSSSPPVQAVCPRCQQQSQIVGKRFRQWFTLFFLPIFPISGSRAFSECSRCGAQFQVDAHHLGAQVAAAEQQQSQQAITLYNSLRNSSANSITLNELMTLYATMKEHDQAISAARDFQQALHNSEQCMTTLGRVYLAKNDHAEALKWFDQAIARNEALAEAHYFRGVALLTSTPPDYAQAAASARSARKLGYPGAEELVREAESRVRGSDPT